MPTVATAGFYALRLSPLALQAGEETGSQGPIEDPRDRGVRARPQRGLEGRPIQTYRPPAPDFFRRSGPNGDRWLGSDGGKRLSSRISLRHASRSRRGLNR